MNRLLPALAVTTLLCFVAAPIAVAQEVTIPDDIMKDMEHYLGRGSVCTLWPTRSVYWNANSTGFWTTISSPESW